MSLDVAGESPKEFDMRRSLTIGCMLAIGLLASWPLAGCNDDDEEIRDQPDGAYYEQNHGQNQNYRDNDRTLHYGEYGGVTVDVRRQGDGDDDDDDWDDDDDDDRRRRYYNDRRDYDDDDDDWDDDDDDDD